MVVLELKFMELF